MNKMRIKLVSLGLFTFIFIGMQSYSSATMAAVGDCKAGEMKSKGDASEKGDGYLVAVKGDDTTKTCVSKINDKRKAKYQKIADENKVPREQVEKEAAAKLAKK